MSQNNNQTSYLFIDGGCLDTLIDETSTRLFGGEELELDFSRFSSLFSKIFYYNCLPAPGKDEDEVSFNKRLEKRVHFFNSLRMLDGFHVDEGITRRRGKRGPEQKQVDVMIAVDMLTHAFRRNMDECTLLTSDLDFKPLLDALVHHGMYTTLWYPENSTNIELVYASDQKRPLTVFDLHDWATPSFLRKFPSPHERISNGRPSFNDGKLVAVGEHKSGIHIEIHLAREGWYYGLLILSTTTDVKVIGHPLLKYVRAHFDVLLPDIEWSDA